MWDNLKSLLFNFDAEKIHNLTVKSLKSFAALSPSLVEGLVSQRCTPLKSAEIPFLGKLLRGPVGLAAGFDKNAELVPFLPLLGFSYAEIGSVTLRAQEGNPKPRLFRGPETLFNRMGFNNDGAEVIAKRLDHYKVPSDFVLGINLGLNKETPHNEAAENYCESYKLLHAKGDYFVINVSSPNTPGLRDLQQMSEIEKIFTKLKAYRSDKAIYLKLASEVDLETREAFYKAAPQMGIDGFVLTNTLKGERESLVGGWSGACLKEISRDALKHAKLHTSLPVLSVGGIMDVEEAMLRMKLGAKLIQIYTGWIFRGPQFPTQINERYMQEFRA